MRIKGLVLAAAALVAIGAATVTTFAAPAKNPALDKQIDEFNKGWADKDYLKKRDAIEQIPTAYVHAVDKAGMKVMQSEEWLFRAKFIIDKLREEADDEVLKEYAEKNAWVPPKGIADKNIAAAVQENMLWALFLNAKFASPENWAKLATLAREPKTAHRVRLRAVRMMGEFKDQAISKANVGALIETLRITTAIKKPKPEEQLLQWHVADSLESLTNEEFGDELKSWDLWWNDNKDKDLKPRQLTRLNKETIEDVDIEGDTVARKAPREVENFEVLFLSEFGRTNAYWLPYAFELNKMFTCSFIDLPDASKVKGLRRPSDRNGNEMKDRYFYPLPQLVEAFDARRVQSGQKKVGVIAHGVNALVALEFAKRKSDSLAFVVIISTWAGSGDGKSWHKALGNMRSHKNPIIRWFGESHLISEPGAREGRGSMNDEQKLMAEIGSEKYMLSDPYSVEQMLYAYASTPNGSVYHDNKQRGQYTLAPDDYEFKASGLKVPALIIWGENDWMFLKEDERIISGAFASPTVSIYKNASRVPWAEDPMRFFAEIRKLVEKSGIKKEDNKAKK